jgi:hypothetical protein
MKCIKDKNVITRNPHVCHGCSRSFPKGTKMKSTTTVDDILMSAYWCETCIDVYNGMDDYLKEDGIAQGDLIDNYPERYAKEETNGKERL